MSFNGLDLSNASFSPTAIDNLSKPSISPRLSSPGPLPLPSFVFPAPLPQPSGSRSAPASFSRASGRRPLSAIETRSQSKEWTAGNGEPSPSPESPWALPRTIPPRPSSTHQRNVSEFIGRDGLNGVGGGLMSTSPTKSEGALPNSPTTLGPPGGRRGHAHRRSAAISVSDLAFILKPNVTNTRGGSAPTSPSAMRERHPNMPSLDAAIQPAKSLNDLADPELSPKTPKSRVGFSDEVSIIPRPLSMVSSDSSSTVRHGHSVSNSMSSIVSGPSSPSSKDIRNTLSSTHRTVDARPRTAEPILDREQLEGINGRGSLTLLEDVAAASTPSTPRSAKKWQFFGNENASGESSPKSRPASAASSAKESKKAETAPSSPDLTSPANPVDSMEPRASSRRSSISKKPSKNKKKVKSWAGSILSRKSRQRKPKLSRRSPTPPLRAYTPPVGQTNHFNFNESEHSVLEKPGTQADFTNWKPRELPLQEEILSPIIDLDAALGPFNTPSSFGDDWTKSQQNGKKKRAMHSAAGLAGFTGPGMHYHRRTESAPEFENARFGLHRLGSNSKMAMEDVFEEDEDEEWEDAKAASDKETSSRASDAEDVHSGLCIDIKVVDSDGMDSETPTDFDDATFQRALKRKCSSLSEGDRRNMSSTKSAHSTTSLIDEPIEEECIPVEIADDSVPPRPDSRAQSSDSTVTPPFRPRLPKELPPVDIQPYSLQAPYPTPTSPISSSQASFPSPRSPLSYDTQRISTAPSSFNDETAFQSLLMGEPGPELRMSVDDVPSLSSSNSTMTRDNSGINTGIYSQLREGHRSASVSSAAINRKRSSLASLSRLISSSHGEKSKLSIESRPQSAIEGEKKEKTSKGKRIGRMMQFWKPKDSSAPAS
ncbi:uncharacterized protein L3040_008865 [Drepanopeziza brunnea f. sp. 'multigermtubi']|nr:hypothetical protein L3040_008865 [Drepanopeziza brunnea f. sp. 'multigermtubi']